MSRADENELQSFAADCRQQLAAHVDALDSVQQAQLVRARQAALAQGLSAPGTRDFRVPGVWLPAGVCAVAASLALAVWISRPSPTTAPAAEVAAVEDAEWLAAGDEPEFYAEEATFYEWAGTAAGAG